MPRHRRQKTIAAKNGAKSKFKPKACIFEMLDDMNISVTDLIQNNATDFVWKISNRNNIQRDKLRSWICWFEHDPNSMVGPCFEEDTYMEHHRPHLMDVLSDLVNDHDDDVVEFEEEENSDAIVEAKINLLGEKRWRKGGHNSNRRGAGSSRTTVYRNQKEAQDRAITAAKHSQDVRSFFGNAQKVNGVDGDQDGDQDGEEKKCDECDGEDEEEEGDEFDDFYGNDGPQNAPAAKLTVRDGLAMLATSVAANASRNQQKENGVKLMAWERLQAVAVCSYLEQRQEGVGKIEASKNVAEIIYRKKGATSYKARSVRFWAARFLLTGEMVTYKQGQHVKTKSVIADEHVQMKLKNHLRSISDAERTPTRFMQDLNNKLLREIDNAPFKV